MHNAVAPLLQPAAALREVHLNQQSLLLEHFFGIYRGVQQRQLMAFPMLPHVLVKQFKIRHRAFSQPVSGELQLAVGLDE